MRLIPMGGFVSMEGEDEESPDPNAFHKKPVWQRIIITAAGAFMNIVIGMIVMAILVSTQKTLPSNTISQFQDTEEMVSYNAGLRVGDTITAVDGVRVHIANEMLYEIMRRGVEPVDITVDRNGESITFKDIQLPTFVESGVKFGNVDFYVAAEQRTPLVIAKHAFYRSFSTIKMIWESLYDLLRGRYGMEAVSGPVGVTEALGEAAEEGFSDLIYITVVISMNLGIMNLLPLPALDGGRLLFQLIELLRRKPINREVEGMIHFAGLVLLMVLFVVITFKDILGLMKR